METEHGISILAAIPMRAEPAEKSEMVNQVLFGEHYRVLKQNKNWLHIKTFYDSYEGWIDKTMYYHISDTEFELQTKKKKQITAGHITPIRNNRTNNTIYLGPGCILPKHKTRSAFEISGELFSSEEILSQDQPTIPNILQNAIKLLETPYLWGGKTPFGIDCSGFIQVLFRHVDISFPRDTSEQIRLGKIIETTNKASEGDLVFLGSHPDKITHIGLLLGKNSIIHASGKVRIDKFDSKGIYNQTTKKYTHKLQHIKRII